MQENLRVIEALQAAGWSSDEIIDFIKYVEGGDTKYLQNKKRQE